MDTRFIIIRLKHAHYEAGAAFKQIEGLYDVRMTGTVISYKAKIEAEDETAIEAIIRQIEALDFVDEVVLDE